MKSEVEKIQAAIVAEQERFKTIRADQEKLAREQHQNETEMADLRQVYRTDEDLEFVLAGREREQAENAVKATRLASERAETESRIARFQSDLVAAQHVEYANEFERLGVAACAALQSAEHKITEARGDLEKFKSNRRQMEDIGRHLQLSDAETGMLTRRQLTKDFIDASLSEFTNYPNPPAYARVAMSIRFKEVIDKILNRLRSSNAIKQKAA